MLGIGLGITHMRPDGSWWPESATLALDFANNRYSVNGNSIKQSDALNTTRSSVGFGETAEGVLIPFASGAPRITNRGLLTEDSATNLLRYTQEFDNSAWAYIDTVAVNDAIAPDGTLTADKVTYTASNFLAQVVFITINPGDVFTSSVYLKLSGANEGDGRVSFRLMRGGTGTFEETSEAITLTSEWQRFDITHTFTNATTAIRVQMNTVGGGATEFHIWGYQLETGPLVTSYIPTTSASATRAADIITTDDISWLTQGQGTFVFEAICDALETSADRVFSLSDGSLNNAIRIYRSALSSSATNIYTSGVLEFSNATANAWTAGVTQKTAIGYDVDSTDLYIDGTSAASDQTVSIPTTITKLNIGSAYFNGGQLEGYIKNLTYYPTRLSNAQLAELTT